MNIQVQSETGVLSAVLMHTPGAEHLYVPPRERERFLIEDVLHVPTASAETGAFQALIKKMGATVHLFDDMLTSILEDEEVRRRSVRRLVEASVIHPTRRDHLIGASGSELAAHLITGNTIATTSLPPVPNIAFQRDLGVVIGETLVISCMQNEVRQREVALFDLLVREHPLFEGVAAIRSRLPIEGGDIIVVRDDLVIIGYGHRTELAAIMDLAQQLFDRGVHTVIAVAQPDQREHMHLDTVFTLVDEKECVVYKPAIFGSSRLGLEQPHITVLTKCGDSIKSQSRDENLLDCLARHGAEFEPVFVGGGSGDHVTADQEQWWDGANTLAVAPGKIVVYDRNEGTIDALRERGYDVHPIRNEGDVTDAPHDTEKVVFAIASAEICKARGGPHCLTMPLQRQQL